MSWRIFSPSSSGVYAQKVELMTVRALELLAPTSERESDPHQGAYCCSERRPGQDETWKPVPKPPTPADPEEETTERLPEATAGGDGGRPAWVRPVRFLLAHARRKRVQRFDHVIERVGELVRLGRSWGVDRVPRPPAQLRVRFGGFWRCYRGSECLLERRVLITADRRAALRLLGLGVNKLLEPDRQVS
jgi:hypothetical protein